MRTSCRTPGVEDKRCSIARHPSNCLYHSRFMLQEFHGISIKQHLSRAQTTTKILTAHTRLDETVSGRCAILETHYILKVARTVHCNRANVTIVSILHRSSFHDVYLIALFTITRTRHKLKYPSPSNRIYNTEGTRKSSTFYYQQ